MSDGSQATPQEPKQISFTEFLETCPPDTELHVRSLAYHRDRSLVLHTADIHLPCDNEKCEGKGSLAFSHQSSITYLTRGEWKLTFETYACRNCRQTTKTFALGIKVDDTLASGVVCKFGEAPAFGPPVPARVISLIGPDREIFLSGRRAENHGLGIGAFAYYRRVVEHQKERIIREIGRVAEKLGASNSDLKLFEAAANETQFSKAIETIRTAIPSALLIGGHNPLTLLHTALSDGLHERSDEECLEYAREIRLVLTDLAERMSQILKESSELKNAVSKLLARAASKKAAEPSGQ